MVSYDEIGKNLLTKKRTEEENWKLGMITRENTS